MKALLPVFYHPLGYVILFVSLFVLFLLVMQGMMADSSLLFYKERTKLLMMLGVMMTLFTLSCSEERETGTIRSRTIRNVTLLTVLSLFGGTPYRVATGDIMTVGTSSFLISLIINVLCLEFDMKKAQIDRVFKK